MDFWSNVSLFALSALRTGRRTWVVSDHDQIRAAAGAMALAHDHLSVLFYWPMPALDWDLRALQRYEHDRKGNLNAFSETVRAALDNAVSNDQPTIKPRRMHRARNLTAKLFANELCREIARIERRERPADDEILKYISAAPLAQNCCR